MPKFRKKPVVIEAVRYDGSNFLEINEWANQERVNIGRDVLRGTLSIATLEGTMSAEAGDWIIRGVQGEYYPCKPAVFMATYEDAE